jgi:hypothetical protein
MKNTIILLLIIASFVFINNYFNGCKDNGTGPVITDKCLADTTITITDQNGNILGGDTTDWCYHDSGGVKLFAAYPNPTVRTCNIRFYEPSDDTVMIYILKTCYDTTIYFKGPARTGTWTIMINDSTDQYKNSYQRVYLKSKHFSSSSYCRLYGDIKFTE